MKSIYLIGLIISIAFNVLITNIKAEDNNLDQIPTINFIDIDYIVKKGLNINDKNKFIQDETEYTILKGVYSNRTPNPTDKPVGLFNGNKLYLNGSKQESKKWGKNQFYVKNDRNHNIGLVDGTINIKLRDSKYYQEVLKLHNITPRYQYTNNSKTKELIAVINQGYDLMDVVNNLKKDKTRIKQVKINIIENQLISN